MLCRCLEGDLTLRGLRVPLTPSAMPAMPSRTCCTCSTARAAFVPLSRRQKSELMLLLDVPCTKE